MASSGRACSAAVPALAHRIGTSHVQGNYRRIEPILLHLCRTESPLSVATCCNPLKTFVAVCCNIFGRKKGLACANPLILNGGPERIRTAVNGFAIRWIASLPPGRGAAVGYWAAMPVVQQIPSRRNAFRAASGRKSEKLMSPVVFRRVNHY